MADNALIDYVIIPSVMRWGWRRTRWKNIWICWRSIGWYVQDRHKLLSVTVPGKMEIWFIISSRTWSHGSTGRSSWWRRTSWNWNRPGYGWQHKKRRTGPRERGRTPTPVGAQEKEAGSVWPLKVASWGRFSEKAQCTNKNGGVVSDFWPFYRKLLQKEKERWKKQNTKITRTCRWYYRRWTWQTHCVSREQVYGGQQGSVRPMDQGELWKIVSKNLPP